MRARIPTRGRPADGVLTDMESFRARDANYKGGRTFSLVYWAGDAHHDLLKRAHGMYMAENALNPMAFQSLKRMEAEVVEMTAGLLSAPPSAVGSMTSGGTESLMVAVFAARERARVKRPWVRRPNVVMPTTAHVALDKAAHWLGVRIKRVPVDAKGRADLRAVKRAVDRNTVLIVGSAPSYPWGVVDPIVEMAAIARRRRIPMHVDACFGGYILPWLERLGVWFPGWDFRVPGVTSISADVHKYGYAAKGASVLLYRDMDHMRHQFFVATHWPGGVYASPSMQGTRPGGPIAAAWAAMQGMGESGYLDKAREAWDAAERLRAGIRTLPGLRVLGLPHSTVVSYTSDDPGLDVYALADQLEAAGWHVDRQQDPPSIHCSVGAANAGVIDDYLADLGRAVSVVRADPSLATRGNAAMYGVIAAIPVRGLTDRAVRDAMAQMYAPGATTAAPGVDATVERAARALKRVKDAVRGIWRQP